jgi:hypothetical protein
MSVSTALAASGVIPFGNVVDPGLAGSHGRVENEQRQFMAQGEQICAVQYRKVRHGWLSSNKTQWERYDRPRYLQSDAEDMIEVDLDNEITFAGDHEECTVGPGEVFVSAVN